MKIVKHPLHRERSQKAPARAFFDLRVPGDSISPHQERIVVRVFKCLYYKVRSFTFLIKDFIA